MAARPSARACMRMGLALMPASGFAALAYQIVWTQQSAVWLGHETAAGLAVVAAFFGGLALGALALGGRIDRSARPARWYAACEAVIAAWSVALAFLAAPAGRALLDIVGPQPSFAWQWAVSFGGTFALLLPATAAMGATLPAMERVMARLRREGSSIGALYAANTFGALAGVLAAAFYLVPEFGLAATAAACAALNLTCAAVALALDTKEPVATPTATPRAQRLLCLLAATGLLGIGYEVLVVRVLSQVAENTVYTFAMLLAVYLAGTAVGAAAYQRWSSGGRRPFGHGVGSTPSGAPADAPEDAADDAADDAVGDRLLLALAAACLLGTVTSWGADTVKSTVEAAWGDGMAAALAGEAALALVAFLMPTVVMGALFSHLGTRARAAGIGLGRSLGVNMLGAAAAPALFGVLLLPAVGPGPALAAVTLGYLALTVRRARPMAATWGLAVVALGVALLAPPLAFVEIPEGGRLVSYRESAMGAVSVVEDAQGVARLRIDNRQQEGSNATLLADARQGLLPVLLHPAPRRALFLGLGTGVTASMAASDAALQVDAVELLPEVIEASAFFTRELPGQGAGAGEGAGARLRMLPADARRYARASDQRYDVIVSDNFHPARRGSGALYTVEHFAAVRQRLADDGLFCQWLPLHQLDLRTLRSIVGAFLAVYPDGWAMLATHSLETPVLGLVARRDGRRFDAGQVRARLAAAALPEPPAAFGIDSELALLGGFVAGPSSLARFSAGAPVNTDDRPVVAYHAPRITYAPDSSPVDRLIELLGHVDITPQELLAPGTDPVWMARLSAYLAARDGFLAAGRGVQPSGDARRMLDPVREPLLGVLRTSPDFAPAYDPLLRMAVALGRSDPAGARALLSELARLQPARPEAAQALSRLGSGAP